MSLLTDIQQIKNETVAGANTALRIGSVLEEMENFKELTFIAEVIENYDEITDENTYEMQPITIIKNSFDDAPVVDTENFTITIQEPVIQERYDLRIVEKSGSSGGNLNPTGAENNIINLPNDKGYKILYILKVY
jgi:hypothetical protein